MDLKALVKKFGNYKIGFVSLKNYKNSHGEVANVLIDVGYDYGKLKKDDLRTLSDGVEYIESSEYSQTDWNTATTELINSMTNPDANRSNGQKEAYITVTKNGALKWHIGNQSLKISAIKVRKTTVEEGNYPTVNSASKTIAKKAIQNKYLKTSKIRYYTVSQENIDSIKINGDTLEITL